jgi:opacity protein-like surface antigen
MKSFLFAAALLAGSAAFAQVDVVAEPQAWEGDGTLTTAFESEGLAYSPPAWANSLASAIPAGSGAVVQPGNADPERDSRGIAVISAPAVAPAGWNGVAAGAAMGGPELDPATGEPAAPASYPACTAAVTDKCVQDYEVGRR